MCGGVGCGGGEGGHRHHRPRSTQFVVYHPLAVRNLESLFTRRKRHNVVAQRRCHGSAMLLAVLLTTTQQALPPPPPPPLGLGELCMYYHADLINDGDCSGTGRLSGSTRLACTTLTNEMLNTCEPNENGGARKFTCDSTGVAQAVHANADCSDDVSTECAMTLTYDGNNVFPSSPTSCSYPRYRFDRCTEVGHTKPVSLHVKYTGTCPEDEEARAREEARFYGLAIGVPIGILLLAAAIVASALRKTPQSSAGQGADEYESTPPPQMDDNEFRVELEKLKEMLTSHRRTYDSDPNTDSLMFFVRKDHRFVNELQTFGIEFSDFQLSGGDARDENELANGVRDVTLSIAAPSEV